MSRSLAYPKGTYKAPALYFRGGDNYSEQETLISEKLQVLEEYKKTKRELDVIQAEHDKVYNSLDRTERYAVQVAENLGTESNMTKENANIRNDIKDHQAELAYLEDQIEYIKKRINPTELHQFYQGTSELIPEIETLNNEIRISTNNINDLQYNMAKSITSKEFAFAINTSIEQRVAQQCRNRIYHRLQSLRNQLNEAPSGNNGKRSAASQPLIHADMEVNDLLEIRNEAYFELEEHEIQKKLADLHRRNSIKANFIVIQEMNEVLSFLGGEPIDLSQVRQNCDIDSIEREENESPGRTGIHSAVCISASNERSNKTPSTRTNSKISTPTPHGKRKKNQPTPRHH